jgi:hypothetical protein
MNGHIPLPRFQEVNAKSGRAEIQTAVKGSEQLIAYFILCLASSDFSVYLKIRASCSE